MTENAINFFNGFNVQTILSMGALLWYFSKGILQVIEKTNAKIDRLDHDIRDMNSRISKLEGTVYGRDLYKDKK